jgi:hypothetical protein
VGGKKFFDISKALSDKALFVGELSVIIDNENKKVVSRKLKAIDDVWQASRNNFQVTIVKSEDGVISKGTGVHELSVDFVPEMFAVK